jgi:opacity protein-like surface antigen
VASVIVPPVTDRAVSSRLFSLLTLACGLTLSHVSFAADADEESSSSETASDDGDASDAGGGKAKDDSAGESESAAEKDEDFGHFGQFGLRVGLNGGLRMVLRYDESPLCREFDPAKGDDQPRFCGHMAPFALDLGLSFALLDWVEPFAWARLGLGAEKETDTKPLLLFGAGVRIYTMSDSAFKIFLEPAIGLEFEKGRGTASYQVNDPEYKQDFVFHLAGGPQLDFSQNVGAYLSFGVTTGVVRAIHSSLDAQLGVQGRYP